VYAQHRRQRDDLAKNVFLANMRDPDEVLFYRLLAEHLGRDAADRLHPRRLEKRSNGTAMNTPPAWGVPVGKPP